MYKKNDRVLAEAGKYLYNEKTVSMGISLNFLDDSEINDFVERDIDINNIKVFYHEYGRTIRTHDRSMTFGVPFEVNTFDGVVSKLMDVLYTEDERKNIRLNRNENKTTLKEYEFMASWEEFFTSLAKVACPLMSIDVNETLESVREDMIRLITKYDSSDNVNSFSYNGEKFWIDKATRVGLMNSTAIQMNSGIEEATLWIGGSSYTLPCATIIQMLSAIEIYALDCYNVTASHKAQVEAMTDIRSIQAFDFKADYPEKLEF